MEWLTRYIKIQRMAPQPLEGIKRVTLREVDLWLQYYPHEDVYYFIDLIEEIDRLVAHGIDAGNQDRRTAGKDSR